MLKTYLDHNATTPVSAEVLQALPELAQAWGNPSSIHWGGRQPKNLLRDARKSVAQAVNAHPLEIVFTSGGSEANNTVLRGVLDYYQTAKYLIESQKNRTHFMCSTVEHPSVMKTMQHLKDLGVRVDFIPVNRAGRIDMDFYREHLCAETALVSVMYANNETGTIFPIREMAALAHAQGALFHADCVQALGKIPVDVKSLDVDFASFSGHKFYALKGAGFLYAKKGAGFSSLIWGGGQERHRRGGTENTLGIACMGLMAERLSGLSLKTEKIRSLRDQMEKRILGEIEGVQITALESARLPNTSSLVIAGVDGETLLMSLDLKGYAVSTGAACSSGNPEPSPVLLAMGLSRAEAQASLRVSLGWENTAQEIEAFVETLKTVIARLRALNSSSEVCHV